MQRDTANSQEIDNQGSKTSRVCVRSACSKSHLPHVMGAFWTNSALAPLEPEGGPHREGPRAPTPAMSEANRNTPKT